MANFLTRLFHPKNINKDKDVNSSPLGVSSFYSSSGVSVTPDTALKLSAVWRAINLLSSSVGKLPLHLYSDLEERVKAKDDPRYYLARKEPCKGCSAIDFFQTMTFNVIYRGNAYAYIKRNEYFEPEALWILPPETVLPRRVNGNITYQVKIDSSTIYEFPYENILHVKGLGSDGLVGYSVIEYMATDGGLVQAMRDYSAEFFANGATPGVIVAPKTTLKEDEYKLLKKSWQEGFAGQGNRHKTAVSPAELSVSTVSINARDAQLIEARAHGIRDIANWFGIPSHKLGDISRSGYNSLESENMAFLCDTLDPWLIKFEQECDIKLLTEEEKRSSSMFFEFKRDALMRADMSARYASLTQATGGPWMSVNEARKIENLNPITGGNDILKPLNMSGTTEGQTTDEEGK